MSVLCTFRSKTGPDADCEQKLGLHMHVEVAATILPSSIGTVRLMCASIDRTVRCDRLTYASMDRTVRYVISRQGSTSIYISISLLRRHLVLLHNPCMNSKSVSQSQQRRGDPHNPLTQGQPTGLSSQDSSLRPALGLEAPGMTPNSVTFLFLSCGDQPLDSLQGHG